MGAVDVDFTIPIVLLASAIAGVVVVRQLARLGARRARARTERLLAEHGAAPPGPGQGIDRQGGASKEA